MYSYEDMRSFLKKLTRLNTKEERVIRGPYLLWFGLVLLMGLPSLFLVEAPFFASEVGVLAGALLAVLFIMFIPMGFINITRIKMRRSRPVFVEPRPLFLVIAWVIVELISLLILGGIFNMVSISNRELGVFFSAETYRSNFIISFVGFAIFCFPITLYYIWINVRYRKIIEYGTAAWLRHQGKK